MMMSTEHLEERLTDKLDYGHGLLQVESCFERLKQMPADYLPASLYAIDVHVAEMNGSVCSSFATGRRGIYIRERHQLGGIGNGDGEAAQFSDFIVRVEPRFAERADHNEKVNFEKHLNLLSVEKHLNPQAAPNSFLQHPTLFELFNKSREFQVRVDTSKLPAGSLHFTEIMAVDPSAPHLGPLFRVPVTVIVPVVLTAKDNFQVERQFRAQPGVPNRFFVHVPEEASYAHFSVKSLCKDKVTKYTLHAIQLLPDKRTAQTEHHKIIIVEPEGEDHDFFHVYGGHTLELCLAKIWSSPGEADVRLQVTFHGARPTMTQLTLLSTEQSHMVKIRNALRFEEVCPSITLRHLCRPLRPTDSKIMPLGPKDVFPDGQQLFALQLGYNFNVSKAADFNFSAPGITDYLYDSTFDGFGMQLFTSTKQYVGAANCFSDRYTLKLEKANDYRLQVMLSHTSVAFLERFRDLCVVARQRMAQPISGNAYSTVAASMHDGRKLGTVGLRAGQTCKAYFSAIPEDRLPKGVGVAPGDYLMGTFCLGKTDQEKMRKKVQYSVRYCICDISKQKTKPGTLSTVVIEKKKKGNGKQFGQEEFDEQLRDQEVLLLSKVSDGAFGDALFQQLEAKYPDHLPLLLAQLKRLNAGAKPDEPLTRERYQKLLDTADKVLAAANPPEVQSFFGARIENCEADLLKKKDMEKRKAAIVEALLLRANAICDAHLRVSSQEVPKIFRRGLHCCEPETKKTAPPNGEEKENKEDSPDAKVPEKDDEADAEPKVEESEEDSNIGQQPPAGGDDQSEQQQQQQLAKDPSDSDLEMVGEKLSQEEFQHRLEELNDSDLQAKQQPTEGGEGGGQLSEAEEQEKQKKAQAAADGWIVTLEEMDEACTLLLKCLSEDDLKALPIVAKRAVAHGHYGTALRALKKLADEKCYDGSLTALSLHTAMVELADQLGWPHVSARLRNALLVKHRPAYRPMW